MAHAINFALHPQLDVDAAARAMRQTGRVHIPQFLTPESADQLHMLLRNRDDWVQVINSEDRLVELSRATRAAMHDEQRLALDTAVYAGARSGFQYRYEAIRVPDEAAERQASADPLATLAGWMSSPEIMDVLRRLTGMHDAVFVDAQATAYSPGDFLTGHDDAFPGKARRAAYVLGLTPVWRAEWGGLLLFHPAGHARADALVPGFNSLNLFRVPQMHSVTEVSRAAAYRRYAITGWLRA